MKLNYYYILTDVKNDSRRSCPSCFRRKRWVIMVSGMPQRFCNEQCLERYINWFEQMVDAHQTNLEKLKVVYRES